MRNKSMSFIKKRKDNAEHKPLGKKKLLLVIVIASVAALALCGIIVSLLENSTGKVTGGEVETVDPWLLDETKPEGFDIMEYDEYLELDRTVYRNDKKSGIKVSVSPDEYDIYGEQFELVCLVLDSVIAGDAETYNSFMGSKSLKKSAFTQQQIYDIEISPYSNQIITDKDGAAYTEYVFEVRYKIHENNGTYRNTVDSDMTRPVYFVINDSRGSVLVMDIIEKNYAK